MIRIGIDVGGTGIQIGVVSSEGKILRKGSIQTRTDLPFSEQVRQMAECTLRTLSDYSVDDVESIGIGIPGIANQSTGEVIKCTNMGWDYLPLRKEFQQIIPKPVRIDNDANVAALAESVAGVSVGTSSSVFITIGTGIGSGIIINGKVWNGYHGIGGEFGHTILELNGIPCTCGNNGCLERYCSATALIRMAREEVHFHPESMILSYAEGKEENINAKMVIDAAREGDLFAEKIYHHYISYLSQAIANIVNFIDPEVIVLGGGVSKAGDYLLKPIQDEFPRYVIFGDQPLPKILLAKLGSDAGIIGAAML